ncbi:MAG: MnmC family methyltransferase, partial [Limibacillus sp.]
APAVLAMALAPFPVDAGEAQSLAAAIAAGGIWRTDVLEARFVLGDARETLPIWAGQADAWFLDGFAPARNPELWEPRLLRQVARHTAPGGTAAPYSAAGAVRRALTEAGFDVSLRAVFGRKLHMTVARLP